MTKEQLIRLVASYEFKEFDLVEFIEEQSKTRDMDDLIREIFEFIVTNAKEQKTREALFHRNNIDKSIKFLVDTGNWVALILIFKSLPDKLLSSLKNENKRTVEIEEAFANQANTFINLDQKTRESLLELIKEK